MAMKKPLSFCQEAGNPVEEPVTERQEMCKLILTTVTLRLH